MYEFSPSYALIANGAFDNPFSLIPLIRSYRSIIAVDGGLAHCAALGMTPDLIIGDFDSIPPELLQKYSQVPVQTFPRDKDQTDLELAVQHIYRPEVEKIGVFGALGKRTDHTLGNLQILRRYPGKIVFETESETLFCVQGSATVETVPGQTVSLIQMGEVHGITTKGLRWELNKARFDKYFYSLSNIAHGHSFHIEIGEGDLICCLNRH